MGFQRGGVYDGKAEFYYRGGFAGYLTAECNGISIRWLRYFGNQFDFPYGSGTDGMFVRLWTFCARMIISTSKTGLEVL